MSFFKIGTDCFLTLIEQFLAISWRQHVNIQWDDDEVRFVLDQHDELDFYSAGSLKQQSAGRHVAPLEHFIHRYKSSTVVITINLVDLRNIHISNDNGSFSYLRRCFLFCPLSLPIILPDLTVYTSNTAGV